MIRDKKNLSESVYARLKSVALTKRRPVQEILQYYAMERFLYRLGVSEYRSSFFLKGGLMLMAWDPATHRATVDIDLLARIDNSEVNFSQVLMEVCSHPVIPDGIEFDIAALRLSESQLGIEYSGLTARIPAHLHTAKLPLHVDIGFSDKIIPSPITVNYPPLLDFPAPSLKGYTPETMIAEKFHVIVTRGFANSRMKDFYDVWKVINRFQITSDRVALAIKEVFRNRNSIIQGIPEAFSEEYYFSPKVVELWRAFLKGIGHEIVPFDKVILDLKNVLLPTLDNRFSLGD